VLTVFTMLIGGVNDIMMILLIFSSFITLIINGKIGYKVIRTSPKMIGAYVSHIGIAIFLLGVVGSAAYSQQKEINLLRGQTTTALGYELTFNDIVLNKDNKYEFVIDVKKSGEANSQSAITGFTDALRFSRSGGQVRPLMYVSDVNNGIMKEPDILTAFVKDLYISPLAYDDGSNLKPEGSQLPLSPNEETTISGVKIRYTELIKPDVSAMGNGVNFQMGVRLQVGENKESHPVDVMLKKEGDNFIAIPVDIPEAKVNIRLSTIDHTSKNVIFVVTPLDASHSPMTQPKEIFTVAVSTKPFISLVWIGVAVMVIGFGISTFRRLKESAA